LSGLGIAGLYGRHRAQVRQELLGGCAPRELLGMRTRCDAINEADNAA
jgi:hypothetical protein